MPIVTLINDWNKDALYLSQITGALLSIDKALNIIDLTPDIKPFDIEKASFVLQKSFKNFPEGTIHLNFIDFDDIISDYFIVFEYKSHFFVSRDNGFLSLVIQKPEKVRHIKIIEKSTFPELKIYPNIVKAILKKSLNKISNIVDNYKRKIPFAPTINENFVIAHIIYIDNYGNLITNLTREIYDNYLKDKKIEIVIASSYKITEIHNSYDNFTGGDLFAVFNNLGLLEIGQFKGNIHKTMAIKNKEIMIKIIKEQSSGQLSIF